jgi:hypothetical protein
LPRGSGGAATLHPQSVADRANSIQCVQHTVQPPGRLEPEGDRYGVLSQRPANHDRLPVLPGEFREPADAATKIISDLVEGRSCAQHQRAVHGVLTGWSSPDIDDHGFAMIMVPRS